MTDANEWDDAASSVAHVITSDIDMIGEGSDSGDESDDFEKEEEGLPESTDPSESFCKSLGEPLSVGSSTGARPRRSFRRRHWKRFVKRTVVMLGDVGMGKSLITEKVVLQSRGRRFDPTFDSERKERMNAERISADGFRMARLKSMTRGCMSCFSGDESRGSQLES